MLLQTNSYIVPKERRAEHVRLLRRFRQVLMRLGCDLFEVYEQMGPNWTSGDGSGRFVQIMRFRDRKHQREVHASEQSDPAAQQLIAEFCDLVNLPYQQQQGLLAIGYYQGVIDVPASAITKQAAAAQAPAQAPAPVARKRAEGTPPPSFGFGVPSPTAAAVVPAAAMGFGGGIASAAFADSSQASDEAPEDYAGEEQPEDHSADANEELPAESEASGDALEEQSSEEPNDTVAASTQADADDHEAELELPELDGLSDELAPVEDPIGQQAFEQQFSSAVEEEPETGELEIFEPHEEPHEEIPEIAAAGGNDDDLHEDLSATLSETGIDDVAFAETSEEEAGDDQTFSAESAATEAEPESTNEVSVDAPVGQDITEGHELSLPIDSDTEAALNGLDFTDIGPAETAGFSGMAEPDADAAAEIAEPGEVGEVEAGGPEIPAEVAPEIAAESEVDEWQPVAEAPESLELSQDFLQSAETAEAAEFGGEPVDLTAETPLLDQQPVSEHDEGLSLADVPPPLPTDLFETAAEEAVAEHTEPVAAIDEFAAEQNAVPSEVAQGEWSAETLSADAVATDEIDTTPDATALAEVSPGEASVEPGTPVTASSPSTDTDAAERIFGLEPGSSGLGGLTDSLPGNASSRGNLMGDLAFAIPAPGIPPAPQSATNGHHLDQIAADEESAVDVEAELPMQLITDEGEIEILYEEFPEAFEDGSEPAGEGQDEIEAALNEALRD
ncbi:hypothetical protein [Humisphaera borealis]|uniref:Uncharacterized protein n=1 Tax=Humisphaera borealis TaxID=2807512 RepID=A0A7M2WZF5_9BACT|nr:hypothetical protein [Humisphaera borealis]QOV90866.1 hypothetical protein IPV69_05765 [Humisphaera borealis]